MTASEKVSIFLELLFGIPLLIVGAYLVLGAIYQLLNWWLG